MKFAQSLALVSSCLAAATTSAQAPGPKQFVQVITVHAKPDGALEYEAWAKKVGAAADKLGLKQRVVAYQMTTGGPGYTYVFATHYDKWAETDEFLSVAEILMKAYGELEGGKMIRAGRANIESTETAAFRLVPELSTKAKLFDPPAPYLQVIRNEIKPDMTRQWERVIGRYKAASEQMAETATSIRRVSVEGPSNVYVTSSAYSKGADRDAWPTFLEVLRKAYGEEEARSIDAQRAECIERSSAYILKYRADLSRLGK